MSKLNKAIDRGIKVVIEERQCGSFHYVMQKAFEAMKEPLSEKPLAEEEEGLDDIEDMRTDHCSKKAGYEEEVKPWYERTLHHCMEEEKPVPGWVNGLDPIYLQGKPDPIIEVWGDVKPMIDTLIERKPIWSDVLTDKLCKLRQAIEQYVKGKGL